MKKVLTVIIQLALLILLISCDNKSEKNVNNMDSIETVDAINESFDDGYDWQINEKEKIDVSDIDIFRNIYKLPYPYKDLDGFNYDEVFPLINNKGLCVVESENIKIMYQAWGGDYFISAFGSKKTLMVRIISFLYYLIFSILLQFFLFSFQFIDRH